MTDLHSRIRTELDRRLAIAREAMIDLDCGCHPGWDRASWTRSGDAVWLGGSGHAVVANDGWHTLAGYATFQHIALHDPSDAILRYTRDLAVLERHAPEPWFRDRPHASEHYDCRTCFTPGEGYDDYGSKVRYPCPDIHDLAESLGIPTTPKGDDE